MLRLLPFLFVIHGACDGKSSLDRESIFKKFERNVSGLSCLFFPAQRPEQLVVSFAAMGKPTYSMWSWFYQKSEYWDDTAYLFINDPSNLFYLGSEEKPQIERYTEIIHYFCDLCGLSCNDVIAVGSSMGGYAALFYALSLGFKGVIVANPIIWFDGERHEDRLDVVWSLWKDIDHMLLEAKTVPHMYLQYCNVERDVIGAHRLMEVYKDKEGMLITKRDLSNDSHENYPLDRRVVPAVIELFKRDTWDQEDR